MMSFGYVFCLSSPEQPEQQESFPLHCRFGVSFLPINRFQMSLTVCCPFFIPSFIHFFCFCGNRLYIGLNTRNKTDMNSCMNHGTQQAHAIITKVQQKKL
eukprot:396734_1